MAKIISKLLLFSIVVINLDFKLQKEAYGWAVISHYDIQKDILNIEENSKALLPDAYWRWPASPPESEERRWQEKSHSPINDNPYSKEINEEKRSWWNFAYIMKLLGKNKFGNDFELWKSWGTHITSDWVAHHEDFLTSSLIK
jgi:hypothetical protein